MEKPTTRDESSCDEVKGVKPVDNADTKQLSASQFHSMMINALCYLIDLALTKRICAMFAWHSLRDQMFIFSSSKLSVCAKPRLYQVVASQSQTTVTMCQNSLTFIALRQNTNTFPQPGVRLRSNRQTTNVRRVSLRRVCDLFFFSYSTMEI